MHFFMSVFHAISKIKTQTSCDLIASATKLTFFIDTFSRVKYSFFVTEDTSCPTVAFEKVGCFRDLHQKLARQLPEYITNGRDPTVKTGFSGKRIDWRNWDIFVPDFACRCAMKAKDKNYTFFGMQFYGKRNCFSLRKLLSHRL